jgi:hypothetical protein
VIRAGSTPPKDERVGHQAGVVGRAFEVGVEGQVICRPHQCRKAQKGVRVEHEVRISPVGTGTRDMCRMTGYVTRAVRGQHSTAARQAAA